MHAGSSFVFGHWKTIVQFRPHDAANRCTGTQREICVYVITVTICCCTSLLCVGVGNGLHQHRIRWNTSRTNSVRTAQGLIGNNGCVLNNNLSPLHLALAASDFSFCKLHLYRNSITRRCVEGWSSRKMSGMILISLSYRFSNPFDERLQWLEECDVGFFFLHFHCLSQGCLYTPRDVLMPS